MCLLPTAHTTTTTTAPPHPPPTVHCSAPYYSFDPTGGCQQCPSDQPAFCDGPAKVPDSGFWQSGARSSQVGAGGWPGRGGRDGGGGPPLET
jgi:hypothetical protein